MIIQIYIHTTIPRLSIRVTTLILFVNVLLKHIPVTLFLMMSPFTTYYV